MSTLAVIVAASIVALPLIVDRVLRFLWLREFTRTVAGLLAAGLESKDDEEIPVDEEPAA